MYVVDIEKKTDNSGAFHLYPIGDLHIDDTGFNEARLVRYIAHIAQDPLAIAVYVGDTVNGTTPGHKHFEAGAVRKAFLTNMDRYITFALDKAAHYFKPLTEAHVPTALVQGNHDLRMDWSGFSWALSQRCGFHYLGDGGFIRVRTGMARAGARRKVVNSNGFYTSVVYCTHGNAGGSRPGGKVNDLQTTIERVDCDVIIKGHLHDAAIRVVDRYGVSHSGELRLVKNPIALLRAPSFLEPVENHTGYAVRKGFGLTDSSLDYLRLEPRSRRILKRSVDF